MLAQVLLQLFRQEFLSTKRAWLLGFDGAFMLIYNDSELITGNMFSMLFMQVILEIFGGAEYMCVSAVVAGSLLLVSISFVVELVVTSFEEM